MQWFHEKLPTDLQRSIILIQWKEETGIPLSIGQPIIVTVEGRDYLTTYEGFIKRDGAYKVKTYMQNAMGRIYVPLEQCYLVADIRDVLIRDVYARTEAILALYGR